MISDIENPYTILNNRVLWYDGDSSYTSAGIIDKILQKDSWNDKFVIDDQEFSISMYNKFNPDAKLKLKDTIDIPDNCLEWNIPRKYLELDVRSFIDHLLIAEVDRKKFTSNDIEVRKNRVDMEFDLWQTQATPKLLNVLIYVVDTFNLNNIVWGVGRGSSCCSYILYLIGIHDVDSIKYELNITDFFRA